ncbi:MAG: hypothetical protein GYB67_10365, partial [Chloroflexi bacterium]|nr:hypothetical protein [Chloroflexota bacterium]
MHRVAILLVMSLLVSNIHAQPTDTAFEAAASEAITGRAALPNAPFYYVEVGRDVDLEAGGGVIYVEPRAVEAHVPYTGIIELLVVVRRGGVWTAYLPGDTGYNGSFEALPPHIRAGIDLDAYRDPADPTRVAVGELTNYGLPYPAGQWGTVTRSFYAHGTGRLDFDLTGREVAAAKDGMIIFASDRFDYN